MLDLFLNTDVRPALESIQAPTLLLRRRGDRHVRGDHARAVAERVRHARLVELDGDDHVWFAGNSDRVLDEIESFLTGQRSATPTNRVLSTVLFTDIVGSTERATVLGDEAWTTALAAHNRVVERHVAGSRGAIVKFTGDGALATSTDRRARSTARARSATRWKTSALPSAPVFTPARSRWPTATSTASRYTSPRASWRSLRPARCSCRV